MEVAIEYSSNIKDIKWLEKELQHVEFKDKRLVDRLIKTSNLLESKASGAINQSCKSWKDTKGAYRLFSNDKFNIDEVYASHYKETKSRIKGKDLVFAIQDTTHLDYDSHTKTKELGSISKAYTKHKKGLNSHSYSGRTTFRFNFTAMLGSPCKRRRDKRKSKKKIRYCY